MHGAQEQTRGMYRPLFVGGFHVSSSVASEPGRGRESVTQPLYPPTRVPRLVGSNDGSVMEEDALRGRVRRLCCSEP